MLPHTISLISLHFIHQVKPKEQFPLCLLLGGTSTDKKLHLHADNFSCSSNLPLVSLMIDAAMLYSSHGQLI